MKSRKRWIRMGQDMLLERKDNRPEKRKNANDQTGEGDQSIEKIDGPVRAIGNESTGRVAHRWRQECHGDG
ncbi:MAG: hypothetical protein ACYC7A_08925 [Thermoanaerobaculia bacterium]